VFIIDRQFMKAAGFALGGAALTFFGFIQGESIGVGQSLAVTASYLIVSAILVGCDKYATMTVPSSAEPAHHASASL
jgi:AGZA family xanthine/uracil permease-like MFS transporter